MRARWDEYCKEFQDPNNNNKVSVCPSPTTPGPVPNGDIKIEGFLLKDTINMSDSVLGRSEYKAAQALLKNLVQPHIQERIPPAALKTTAGQLRIIEQQHIDAVSNIAREVIASIIARRTAIAPDPGNPNSIAELVNKIRRRAQVPAAQIMDGIPIPAGGTPSYNEMMLSLTKERFFDPEYFARMQNDVGAIKQEQAAVDAITAVQLQDIYRLQEQINAVLGARAAIKFQPLDVPGAVTASPMK
jgi:hypothetical protein